jgi:hypothetical protein
LTNCQLQPERYVPLGKNIGKFNENNQKLHLTSSFDNLEPLAKLG